MELTNIRIDDRLIHGQVATAWSMVTKANRIVVVDNAVVKDTVNKEALKLACPQQCKLSIINTERAVENFANNKYEGERVLLIVKNPATLVDMWDKGFRFETVNVGNMGGNANTKMLVKAVSVTETDIANFRKLVANGVAITSQMVPTDDVVDFAKLL